MLRPSNSYGSVSTFHPRHVVCADTNNFCYGNTRSLYIYETNSLPSAWTFLNILSKLALNVA